MVRLLIHQALKDLRVVRWLALAWLVLIVGFQAFGVWLAHAPLSTDSAVPTYAAMLGVAVALFAVIAVIVVQNDPAVGTTAFWFTRPISVSVLLGSKFLLAFVLLIVVPIVADVAAMVAGGLSLAEALGTMPASLVTAVAWLLPLVAIAAITVNLAQFVLAVVIEVFVFLGADFALRGVFASAGRWGDARSTDTLVSLLVAGVVAFGLGSLVYAYRARTLRRAATFAGLAPIAMVFLVLAWPWPWGVSFTGPPPSPVTAAIVPASLTLQPGGWGMVAPIDTLQLSGAIRFSNMPPGQVLSPGGVRASIQYPHERVNLRASLRAADTGMALPGFMAAIPKEGYERHRNEAGVLQVDLAVTVYAQQATAIPVRAGEEYRGQGRVGRILSFSAGPEVLSIDVQQIWIRPEVTARSPNAQNSVACVVRNRRLGATVSPSKSRGTISLPEMQPPVPVPAHLAGSRITFSFPWPESVSSADWMRGAEFVVHQSRVVGDAIVHATVPDFVLSSLKSAAPSR